MANIVNEKPRTITPIRLPNPAKGTPKITQKMTSKDKPKMDKALIERPRIETHARGCALYAKILYEANPTTLKKDVPPHLDSPANRGGLSISMCVVFKPTHAPSPRRNL